jgi:hypothetical protein
LFPENSSTLHSSYICISQLITFLATVHMINQFWSRFWFQQFADGTRQSL